LLRIPADTLVGLSFTAHVEVDHRPAVHAALRRAAAGYPVSRLECCLGAAGAVSWIELDASPTREGCVLVARELQHRQTTRSEMTARQTRLHDSVASLLDTLQVGIVITDGSGTPRLVNRLARDLLGAHAHTPLAQWAATGIFRRPDGGVARENDLPYAGTVADGRPHRDVELRIVRPWGEMLPVMLNTDAVLDEEGHVVEVYCTIASIRQRRRIERQLRQAQKMEAVGTLAAGIAHDFNNLLCAITGYGELALMQCGLDARGRDLIGEIKRASDQAAVLTRRLLTFSRADATAPRALHINTAVREMDPILSRLIGREVDLSVSLGSDIGHIQGDPGQIGQILLNLVVNARDAMPDGGSVEIRTRCVTLPDPAGRHTVGLPPGRYAVLSVRDDGCGMSEETVAHVFEPFYTTKASERGTGLGLSTVYGIVKQSGGAVDVRSRPGEGSSFRVYLPCADAEVLPDAVTPSSNGTADTERETILVVEDEPLVRSLICAILEEAGHAVMEASNGVEALERTRRAARLPDLVVTDVLMPEMGGRELAAHLWRQEEGLKILFVSGHVQETVGEAGSNGRNTAFLPKPFDAASLSSTVRSLLDCVPA
jgi:signal transduction histidine kinase/CheY-like chemotaxis protein